MYPAPSVFVKPSIGAVFAACLRNLSASAILRLGAAVPSGWRLFPPHPIRGEVVLMVTYAELFQLLLVLIAFAGLIIQISKRK